MCPKCLKGCPQMPGFMKNWCDTCLYDAGHVENDAFPNSRTKKLGKMIIQHWLNVKWNKMFFGLPNLMQTKSINVPSETFMFKPHVHFLCDRMRRNILEKTCDENWEILKDVKQWNKIMNGWRKWFMTMVLVCRRFPQKYKDSPLSTRALPPIFYSYLLNNYFDYY